MTPRFVFDHLAVTAPTLTAGLTHVRQTLGVEVPPGGTHPQMGTHNRLMRLGDDAFLEIIAVDPMAPAPGRSRWYDLDRHHDRPPILSTWVVRTDDLDAAVRLAPASVGKPTSVSRGDLSWRITVPDDGGMPFDGAYPTLIQWPQGPLPATRMTDLGCRLARLIIEHPQAAEIRHRLQDAFSDDRVVFHAAEHIRLSAEIETPAGTRALI